jgi:hypothetical protein
VRAREYRVVPFYLRHIVKLATKTLYKVGRLVRNRAYVETVTAKVQDAFSIHTCV